MSLSQRELDLITKIGECIDEYRSILYEDEKTWEETEVFPGFFATARDGDINEFSGAVHIMQRMVMARSAQRQHPDFFPRRPAPVVDEWDFEAWRAGQIPPKGGSYDRWTRAALGSSPGANYRWDGYAEPAEWFYVGPSV